MFRVTFKSQDGALKCEDVELVAGTSYAFSKSVAALADQVGNEPVGIITTWQCQCNGTYELCRFSDFLQAVAKDF